MAIEPHINNMIQKLDGFWLNNNALSLIHI